MYSDLETLEFLASEDLAVSTYAAGTSVWRIHSKDCVIDNRAFKVEDELPHEIIHWSNAGRFGTNECPVLYVGESQPGAFLETMCTNPAMGVSISAARLAAYACSEIELPKPFRMVSFVGADLIKNRLDANVFSSTDPDVARRRTYRFSRDVAKAVLANPRGYDGIVYQSRVNPDNRNAAIFFKSPKLHRALQANIVMAMQTLIHEPWVYEMQSEGDLNLEIMR
ncbi:MAG: RES family NAD+ phosphorylase [Gammaproteobacteria bacterium]